MPRLTQAMFQQTVRRRVRRSAATHSRRPAPLRQRPLEMFEPADFEPATATSAPPLATFHVPGLAQAVTAPRAPAVAGTAGGPTFDPLDLVAPLAAGGSFGAGSVRSLTLDAPLGDAMVGAGDRLLLSERPPNEGELALVEAGDGTRRLRRLYRDGDTVLLQPEDHSLPVERCSADEVAFVGTVITIARCRPL